MPRALRLPLPSHWLDSARPHNRRNAKPASVRTPVSQPPDAERGRLALLALVRDRKRLRMQLQIVLRTIGAARVIDFPIAVVPLDLVPAYKTHVLQRVSNVPMMHAVLVTLVMLMLVGVVVMVVLGMMMTMVAMVTMAVRRGRWRRSAECEQRQRDCGRGK